MKDYKLLRTWKPSTENEFEGLLYDFKEHLDMSDLGVYNSLEEITDELEYQGFNFKELVQLTKNRYGNVMEIIEHDSSFYLFIGAN